MTNDPAAIPPKNTLGLTAFIFSILGVTCLPVLGALAGLVCGIIAVRREPRGFAIAAIAISAVGGCLIVPIFLLPAILLPALAKARATVRSMETAVQGEMLQMEVERFRADRGRLPNDLAESASHAGRDTLTTDSWGNEFKLVVDDGEGGTTYSIRSAGRDGAFDTEDDVVITSMGPVPDEAAEGR